MLRAWTSEPVSSLLKRHELASVPEAPFPNDGWSGATLTRLVRPRDGQAFVVKRTSWATDWIARSTRDHALREGFVAAMPLPLAEPLVAPYHGAGADGTSVGILMPDLTSELIGWERATGEPALSAEAVERVVSALARLHSMPWPVADRSDAVFVWPSVPLRERLLLLTPNSATRLAAGGVPAGERFLAGWAAFDRLAPSPARELVASLDRDARPLLRALGALPATVNHGDMKLSNVAFLGEERVALIDWQMIALAPVAVELGWLLVSNSGALPERPEAVLERYIRTIRSIAGTPVGPIRPFDPLVPFPLAAVQAAIGSDPGPTFRTMERSVGDWDAQVDLGWIIGLLMRGWRKGLDAEAGATLASGISAGDDLADWSDRAVDAARRRL
jgi:Phosphotransferase enzyme family